PIPLPVHPQQNNYSRPGCRPLHCSSKDEILHPQGISCYLARGHRSCPEMLQHIVQGK
ncbi:hypothetical protein A2U01_0105103, partial [Trifolium medium]|nr:hypothetical protein [Trifolium medium]